MERKEAYRLVKELGLQEEIKSVFGDNYTRVTTVDLESVINHYQADGNNEPEAKEDSSTDTENPYEAACVAFIGILKDSGLLEEILEKL